MTRQYFKGVVTALSVSGVIGALAVIISCFCCHRSKIQHRESLAAADRRRLRIPWGRTSFPTLSRPSNFTFSHEPDPLDQL